MSQDNKEIDTDLYSRQMFTFGKQTMGKLIKMNVLLSGLRGVGVQTAKNIVLAGPKAVDVHDPTKVQMRDLSANFYCNQSHVGKVSRSAACVDQLKELNPNVMVSQIKKDKLMIQEDDFKKYDVIIATELLAPIDYYVQIDEYCRKNNKVFILSQTLGAAGYIFTDFGPKFKISDQDGEECKSFIISSISNQENAVVTVHEDKKHSFGEWNHVVFKEIQGMQQINNHEPVEISVIDGYSFKLKLDTTKFSKYAGGGIVTQQKVPVIKQYKSLAQALHDPVCDKTLGMLTCPDYRFFGHSEQIHIGLLSLYEFFSKNGRLPALNNEEDTKSCLEEAQKINNNQKEKNQFSVQELDKELLTTLFNGAASSISQQAAFFGGIIAQEVVKFTGKYTPINQWFHYDTFESIPKEANRALLNCRYDDQIAIYGREIQEKLGKQKIFMVGAGALGCQYLKAFALMGVGTKSQGGSITVTDNDNIEKSNLNRQFLFRNKDIGHSKSECAGKVAQFMNNDLQVKSMTSLVAPSTEDTFNNDFWDGLDFVVNAVDNIKARLYVDSKCVWHHKALLQSGTLGTKANSQMVIPNLTKCYGDSRDPPQDAIAMCTLRNFPNQIEHCIEWGRDKFTEKFTNQTNDVINYLTAHSNFIKDCKANNTPTVLKDTLSSIDNLISLKKTASFDKLIQLGRNLFDEYFVNTIKQLLHLFPENHLNSDGQKFWSGPKRCPVPLKFDANDQIHTKFVAAYANLIAFNLKMKQNRDMAYIAKVAGNLKTEEFVPKSNVKIQTEQNQKVEDEPMIGMQDEKQANELIAKLKNGRPDMSPKQFQVVDFEKDDDSNFHIDFIHAAANLRARNYRINEESWQKTKFIAGKITPAIATSTAMITGAVSAEMLKVVQNMDKLESYKNAFINLAIGMFVFSEPDEVAKMKDKEYDEILLGPVVAIPPGWTIWDKIVVQGPMTLGGLMEKFKADYQVSINMVTYGQVTLYSDYFVDAAEAAVRMKMNLEAIYQKVAKENADTCLKMMILGIGSEKEGVDANMPPVCYKFA